MMCDMGVIFKMMLFNCLLALLGSILAEGKRHSLELLEMSFLKNQKSDHLFWVRDMLLLRTNHE